MLSLISTKMTLSIVRCMINTSSRRLFSQTCILPYKTGRFKAAQVKYDNWPHDDKMIRDSLQLSLKKWKEENFMSAWLWIPIEKAHVIPIAAELGFCYHNAEDRTAILYKWLEASPCLIPRFATHQVGVGCAVLHSKTNELLVIKERIRNLEFWKLPGGVAELSEDIGETAVREVFEETGVQTKFESVLGFRQTHNAPGCHGRSDLYFVCRLSAVTHTINIDQNEILDCKWITLEDALKSENSMLQRISKQLLFGLQHGFQESIDISNEQIMSIVTGRYLDFYIRSLK